MDIQQFPGCCAAAVIYRLDNEWELDRPSAYPEPPEYDAAQVLKNLKDSINHCIDLQYPLVMATTNQNQTQTEQILILCGFKLLTTFENVRKEPVKMWVLHHSEVDLTKLDTLKIEDLVPV